MRETPVLGLLGGRSLVGRCVIEALVGKRPLHAFSRRADELQSSACLIWRRPDLSEGQPECIGQWISVMPIFSVPRYFPLLERLGATRIVALSSTSLFTKAQSKSAAERALARQLAQAETALQEWAESRGIEWIILRPTLIYGLGCDRNVSEIARFIRRFRFFPLIATGAGLRQPVHASDVADASIAALAASSIRNRAYNLSGGETLAYRAMVARIFAALQMRPVTLPLPFVLFRLGGMAARLMPRYRHWSSAAADRMNQDLVFDHDDAARDLQFFPRGFYLTPEDIP